MLAARADFFFDNDLDQSEDQGYQAQAKAKTKAQEQSKTAQDIESISLSQLSSVSLSRPKPATRKAFVAATLIYGSIVAGTLVGTTGQVEEMKLEVGGATHSIGLDQFVAAPAPTPVVEETQVVEPEPEQKVQPEPIPEPIPEPVVQPEPKPEPEPIIEKAPEPKPEPKVEPKPEPKPEPVKKVEPKKEVKPQPKPVVAQKTAQPQPETKTQPVQNKTASKATGTPQSNRPQVMVYGRDHHPVLAQIKGAIDGALLYPRKAQMMRAEGVAVVQFTYTTNGSIKALKLLKSTGNRDLDKAALLTIKRAAGNFPRVEQNFTLRLPIAFEIR